MNIEVRDRVEFLTSNGTRRGIVKNIRDGEALVVYKATPGKWDTGRWVPIGDLTKIADGTS